MVINPSLLKYFISEETVKYQKGVLNKPCVLCLKNQTIKIDENCQTNYCHQN